MATVIEVLNKKGEVITAHRCVDDVVQVGRGYENQVTIADDFLDAVHVNIVLVAPGVFRAIDQGTVNGTQLHKKSLTRKKPQSILDMKSGDELTIGRTRIRIVDSSLPMVSAKKLVPQTRISRLASRPLPAFTISIFTMLLLVYDFYADSVREIKLSAYFTELFQIAGLLLIVSFIMSLIAKAIRHQWFFYTNLFNLSAYILLIELSSSFFNILYFNFGYWQGQQLSNYLFLFILIWFGGWIFTFNLFSEKQKLRIFTVSSFAGLVLAYIVLQSVADQNEYVKHQPNITDRFSSWVLPSVEPVSDQQFVKDSADIFNRIELDDQ